MYDKNTSFWVAPTVRISARKPGFPGFDNNHVSESSWRTLDCGVFDVFHSDRFPRLGIVHLPRRYYVSGTNESNPPLKTEILDFFSLKKLKSMNLGHCNIENLKISNFVFSLLVSQKPVSGE